MAPDRFQRHLVATLYGVALIALVLFLPDLAPRTTNQANGPLEAYRGRIERISSPSSDPDSGVPPVPVATVTFLDGPRAGQQVDAYLAGPSGNQDTSTYAAGQEVVVTITKTADGSQDYVEVSDRWRLPGLGILALLCAIAVVVIGGWQGVRALVALGLTAVIILKVLLPLIVAGVPPVPLAVLTASAVTVLTILLTEGWGRSSLAAILGTTGALAIAALLAAVATAMLGFTYTAGSDLAFLATPGGGGLDLRGVLLAAIILGSVGVLDDVTVTQAVLVEELSGNGGLEGSALVRSAMTIGRSHIGATVNTLFLAYVGVGLPLLIVLMVSAQPSAAILNDELIATEIVRTLVGSLGIVLAIPLTTFIAAPLVDPGLPGARVSPARTRARIGVVVIVVVLLLLATSASSLLAPSRAPLAADTLARGSFGATGGPGPSGRTGGGVGQPSGDAGASGGPVGTSAADVSPAPSDPATPGGQLQLIPPGTPVPVPVAGQDVGTVTVRGPGTTRGPGAGKLTVSATIHYEASAPFPLSSGDWEVLLDDGSEVALAPVSGDEVLKQTLAAGESLDVPISGTIPKTAKSAFIVYVDAETESFVFAVDAE